MNNILVIVVLLIFLLITLLSSFCTNSQYKTIGNGVINFNHETDSLTSGYILVINAKETATTTIVATIGAIGHSVFNGNKYGNNEIEFAEYNSHKTDLKNILSIEKTEAAYIGLINKNSKDIQNIKSISFKNVEYCQVITSIIEIFSHYILAYFLTRLFPIVVLTGNWQKNNVSEKINRYEKIENIVVLKNIALNCEYYIPWKDSDKSCFGYKGEPLSLEEIENINFNEKLDAKEIMKRITNAALKVATNIVLDEKFIKWCDEDEILNLSLLSFYNIVEVLNDEFIKEYFIESLSKYISEENLRNNEELMQKIVKINGGNEFNKENNFIIKFWKNNETKEIKKILAKNYKEIEKDDEIKSRYKFNAIISTKDNNYTEAILYIDGTIKNKKFSFAVLQNINDKILIFDKYDILQLEPEDYF